MMPVSAIALSQNRGLRPLRVLLTLPPESTIRRRLFIRKEVRAYSLPAFQHKDRSAQQGPVRCGGGSLPERRETT